MIENGRRRLLNGVYRRPGMESLAWQLVESGSIVRCQLRFVVGPGACVNCSLLTDSCLLRDVADLSFTDVLRHAPIIRKPIIVSRSSYGSFHLGV